MRIIYFKVSFIIFLAVICLSSFTGFDFQKEKYTPINLKVLPKKISEHQLDSLMKGFNTALGVKCNYCHAPKADGERGLDFASDENPKKDIARAMIKMTNKINKSYFRHEDKNGVIARIGCATCHNGQKEPKSIL